MDCCPLCSSVHGILQARILEWVACCALLQEIFLTQGLNHCLLCLLHWQADSLPLSHLGSSKMFENHGSNVCRELTLFPGPGFVCRDVEVNGRECLPINYALIVLFLVVVLCAHRPLWLPLIQLGEQMLTMRGTCTHCPQSFHTLLPTQLAQSPGSWA